LIPISRSTKHQTLVAKDHQAATLPLRLQAYERMTLFMERINPSQLMVRIPLSENKNDYQNFVIAQIEQEHNLSQQIYISEMLVYYCYRQKRDNPNDAFGCKMKIKMPMVCDKQLSVIYWKNHLRAVRH
jgi:hypothetical protein